MVMDVNMVLHDAIRECVAGSMSSAIVYSNIINIICYANY